MDFESASRTIITRAPLVPRSVVAALGLGLSFGIGIVVGGGLGTARGQSAPQVTETNVLALADARADALDTARAKMKLTFPTELAKPDAPPIPRVEEKQGRVDVSERAPASSGVLDAGDDIASAVVGADLDADRKEHATVPVATTHSPLPAPKGGASSVAVAPPGSGEGSGSETAGELSSRSEPSSPDGEESEPPQAMAAASEKADPARLQVALARVLGSAPAVVNNSASPSGYALQVAATPTRDAAMAVAEKVIAQGHRSAKVVEGDVGGKVVFRVRLGGFAERRAAEAYKAKLSMPAFIVAD